MTIADETEKYIQQRASIKYCLKRGLINYSALARLISKDMKIKSKEAILIAARRFQDKIKNAKGGENILRLFENSNIEIKNNVVVFTIEKNIYPDALIDTEKRIKRERGMFFAIEGTKSLTIIVQKQNKNLIKKKFRNFLLEKKEDLSLITITVQGIGDTPGAVFYLTSLFFEHSINIEEFMSCYDDTLIVIKSDDLGRVMEFLRF